MLGRVGLVHRFSTVKISRMKSWLILVFLSSPLCLCVFAQTKPDSAIQTRVCDIVAHPKQFEGKSVQVRAQIWTDHSRFWLNESSFEFGKACRWLPAEFTYSTSLAGSSAFGTFTGRLIRDSRSPGHMLLLIERESDIYRQQLLNGLLPIPRLFDAKSKTFFRPE
jgi:hypothetical protein